MLDWISRYQRLLITGGLVFFSLSFVLFFRESDGVSPIIQGFIVSTVFFLVIPVLYCKMILKESLKNIGWQKGNMLRGLVGGALSVGLGLVLVMFLLRWFPIREQIVLPNLAERNFFWFVAYELGLVAFTVLLYEVFFRGLVQLLWLRQIGWWAVLFQAALFWVLLYLGGNFDWRMAPFLIFSIFSGLIAHFSRSIWYSWGANWLFLFVLDVFSLMSH